MKKAPVDIDQLFAKAASTPMHTSFDEAKETFTESLAQRGKGGKNFFRSFKWILMTTLIIGGIAAITIAFYHDQPTTDVKKAPPITEAQVQISDPKEEVVSHLDEAEIPKLERMEFERELLALPIPVIQNYLSEPKKLLVEPNYLYYRFASDFREKKDSIEIPELTEKEIAANNKQKRKMIKALAKHNKDHYAYIPSGTTRYRGKVYSVQAFFMQREEVSNLQYRTFLNDLIIQGRIEDYKLAFPQTEQWTQQIEGDVMQMQNLYHWHPAYDNYPAVNITREGAEMYCIWLTTETNNSKFIEKSYMINDLRLPQRTEWCYAATSGDTNKVYPWGGPSTQNAEACYLANYMPDSTNYADDGGMFTVATGSYHSNDFGMYCMSGNVAEMVYGPTDFESLSDLVSVQREPGTAGGGWMDEEDALKIEGDDPYYGMTEGHPNIGFRPVMTHIGRTVLVGEKGN